MENTSIGTRIKQRRNELGLKQRQIQQATGISSGNLSDIENGNKLPSTPALISLSSILDCSIDWMLKGDIPKGENVFLSNESDLRLLDGFHKLSKEDKEEVLEYIDFKINRLSVKKGSIEKSSNLDSKANLA